jgi:hypothetical protein
MPQCDVDWQPGGTQGIAWPMAKRAHDRNDHTAKDVGIRSRGKQMANTGTRHTDRPDSPDDRLDRG